VTHLGPNRRRVDRSGRGRRRVWPRPALLGILLLTMLVGLGCSTLGTGAPGGPKQMLKLRLGVASTPAPVLPNAVLWVAKDLGFYEKEGLDVDVVEVDGTPSIVAGMRSGDLDVGNLATEDVIKLTSDKTFELRAIHSPDSRQYFMIAGRDEVKSLADLSGKNFAVARVGSLDHLLTARVLDAGGVKSDTLKYVAIGAPAVRAQALAGGRVDATTMSIGTWATIQRQPGVKVLMSQEDYFKAVPIVQKVDAVTLKVLKDKPEELRRFTAAIIKVSRYLAENKQAWIDVMATRRSDVSKEDAADLYDQFKTSWAVNGIMNLDEYQKTADFFYQEDDYKALPHIPVSGWADTQFVDATLKDIGVYDKYDDPGRAIH
jgi:NitT/TauT family transport system substrate-binding protein